MTVFDYDVKTQYDSLRAKIEEIWPHRVEFAINLISWGWCDERWGEPGVDFVKNSLQAQDHHKEWTATTISLNDEVGWMFDSPEWTGVKMKILDYRFKRIEDAVMFKLTCC